MGTSQDLVKEMQRLYPNDCKIIKVKMLYEKEVRKYLMQTEKAYRKASKSKLRFCLCGF